MLITDEELNVGISLPSGSTLFLLQEDAHAAGTKRFTEADLSVNCESLKMLIHISQADSLLDVNYISF
jgi:hypothetical protein